MASVSDDCGRDVAKRAGEEVSCSSGKQKNFALGNGRACISDMRV